MKSAPISAYLGAMMEWSLTKAIIKRNMNRFSCVLLLLFLSTGCGGSGPELGNVMGRVTLDGQPLHSARLNFQPDGNRSPSTGYTDSDGRYELLFKRGVDGALLGSHTIQIRTSDNRNVPAKYNDATELVREVKAGDNVINFELTSK
jgi:hypothetical protein